MPAKGFAVNGRFWRKTQTGVERYAREISSRLGEGRLIVPVKRLAGLAGHIWEQLSLPLLLRHGEALWSPANSGPALVSRQVLTIQHLSPIDHPEWFKPAFARWYRLLWTILAPRTRLIVAPSQFTRQRILAKFKIPGERILIVPGGVSPDFHPASRSLSVEISERYQLPEDYVLFVGTPQPRKNLQRLLSAWSQVEAGYPHLAMLIVGSAGEVFSRQHLNSGGSNVRFLGYAPDEHLAAFYSRALALVYPSLYEGFGLAVLEAMACGAPVIAADIAPLRELLGEAGYLVNARCVECLAEGIKEVIENVNLRHTLRAKGLRRAREFSWDRAAQSMAQIMHALY